MAHHTVVTFGGIGSVEGLKLQTAHDDTPTTFNHIQVPFDFLGLSHFLSRGTHMENNFQCRILSSATIVFFRQNVFEFSFLRVYVSVRVCNSLCNP